MTLTPGKQTVSAIRYKNSRYIILRRRGSAAPRRRAAAAASQLPSSKGLLRGNGCLCSEMWTWLSSAAAAVRAASSDWVLMALVLVGTLYLAGTWTYNFFERLGIAHHKPKIPFVGSTIAVFLGMQAFQDFLMDMYKAGKGRSVFGIFQLLSPAFIIRDPELLRVVAVKEFDSFPNHMTVFNEKADPIFAKNLTFLKDQPWRDTRATLSPAFTTSKIKSMFQLISGCGEKMAGYLKKRYAESLEGTQKLPLTTDMKDLFTRLANDVIATAAFGVDCDSLSQPENAFYAQGKRVTTFTGWRLVVFAGNMIFPSLMAKLNLRVLHPEAASFFTDLVLETIEERQRKNIVRPDVLQLLIKAKAGQLTEDAEDEKENIQKAKKLKLTDEDVVAQAVLFFFAGFETVSTALCFTAVALSHEPEVQTRLQEEVDDVMKKTEGKLTYEAIQGMKYLDMVINESLRRYTPIAGVDRVCTKTTTLPATATDGPVTICKGSMLWVPVYGIHHDSEYWPDPYKFDPERFSDENKHNIKPFTFMPFGLGPRICLGQRFALLEVKIALAHLLAHFDLKPCSKTEYPIKYAPGFNVNARGGLWCDLVPRNLPLVDIPDMR